MDTADRGRRARSPRGQGVVLAEEIVATALDRVDADGATGLTLRGLAREVGVSAPAIYAHFADLDAVMARVAGRAFDHLAEHLRAATAGDPDPAEPLRVVCGSYLGYAEAHPGRYLVMFGGQWDAATAVERGAVARDAVDALGQDVMAILLDVISSPQGPGDPEPDDVVHLAVTVWVLLHGYAHQRLVAGAFPWPPGMTERVVDAAVRLCRDPGVGRVHQ